MKKIGQALFILFVPLLAGLVIWDYYESLPISGAYETGPIDYPDVHREKVKERLAKVETSQLKSMRRSGLEVIKWDEMMDRVGKSVISEVVPENEPFIVREHYPYSEVFDDETRSLYFYHSHRPGEHGHFHLFYCDQDKIQNYKPLFAKAHKAYSVHLLAISIHPDGTPLGFFTTNQWITPKEWWYDYKAVQELVGSFEITHAYPSFPTNQWMNHMLRLFKPQIDDLLEERDLALEKTGLPLEKALMHKKLDVLSFVPIDVETQLEVIDEILAERSAK